MDPAGKESEPSTHGGTTPATLLAWVERRPIGTLSALFAVCVVAFLITIPLPRVDNLLIGSDGVLYYEYVHSLVIDGDLDFRNEHVHFFGPDRLPPDTPAGRPPNKMSIGTGLVWIPFFGVAHAVSALLGLPTDGYSYIYQAAVCLGSMTYGFIGLLLTYLLCRERADATNAVIAVVLIWFASNVVYYMVIEPSMSHMASLGAVSALLAWWRLRRDRHAVSYWIGLGALGGLAALIRPQDGVFLLLPAADWLIDAIGLVRAGHVQRLAAHIGKGASTVAAAGLVFAIQLWAWHVVYGSVHSSGYFYGGRAAFYWFRPRVLTVLFSPFHGFFTWHPIYLAGALGLWWVGRNDRTYAALLALGVALQVYLVAAWYAWWQGDAFGGRMLISTAPILAIGLTPVVERLRRISWLAVAAPAAILLLWNVAFLVQYRLGLIPMGHPISLQQLVWGKFTLPFDLWHRFAR
jgi:hypothetical protein